MLKVGLTGGIGSGKTLVSRIFQVLGIPVYYADDRAKELMISHPRIISELKNRFGKEIYLEDGNLNKALLREKIFNYPDEKKFVDALVHPIVKDDGTNWFRSQKNVPYALKEAALLIESGNFKDLDKIILVISPLEFRIPRIAGRDNISHDEVEKRIKNQLSDEEKKKYADFIIHNDDQHSLIEQVLQIHFCLTNA